jgi:anthranilate/para-aminobenzoate synthase component II
MRVAFIFFFSFSCTNANRFWYNTCYERRADFGVCGELLKHGHKDVPVLGVCLGHQGLGMLAGAQLKKLDTVYHGVISDVAVVADDSVLFEGIPVTSKDETYPRQLKCVRYHSWAIDQGSLPSNLRCTAVALDDGFVLQLLTIAYSWRLFFNIAWSL